MSGNTQHHILLIDDEEEQLNELYDALSVALKNNDVSITRWVPTSTDEDPDTPIS